MRVSVEEAWDDFSCKLLNFIKGRVAVKEDAEDILQDVFVRIQLKMDQLKDEQRLKSWIYSITSNAIKDYWKNKGRFTLVDADASILAESQLHPADEAHFDRCLTKLVDRLPTKYMEAIKLSELEEMPQKEVAEKMGIGYEALKSRVQRGRQILKQSLVECCDLTLNEKRQYVGGHDADNCEYCACNT